jgi:hypothetical protein
MVDRTFASLVPRVQSSAPGCPQPTIVQHVRDAAIRACERTLAWRVQLPKFNLSPGVFEYHYDKPTNTDVHAVFSASVNNAPLDVLTLEQAITTFPKWADIYSGLTAVQLWSLVDPNAFNSDQYNESPFNGNPSTVVPDEAVAEGSTPTSICQLTPDKYIVLPLPDKAEPYNMRMFVALKPKRTATGLDETIFDELEDVILHNALQHLLVLPNTNWSDRELAAYHAKQFIYQVSERRARANLGNARGTLRVKMQPF